MNRRLFLLSSLLLPTAAMAGYQFRKAVPGSRSVQFLGTIQFVPDTAMSDNIRAVVNGVEVSLWSTWGVAFPTLRIKGESGWFSIEAADLLASANSSLMDFLVGSALAEGGLGPSPTDLDCPPSLPGAGGSNLNLGGASSNSNWAEGPGSFSSYVSAQKGGTANLNVTSTFTGSANSNGDYSTSSNLSSSGGNFTLNSTTVTAKTTILKKLENLRTFDVPALGDNARVKIDGSLSGGGKVGVTLTKGF